MSEKTPLSNNELKVLIILIIPTFLVFYLYPQKERVIFSTEDGYQRADKIDINHLLNRGPGFKNHLADILGTKLDLDWYWISVVNTGKIKNIDRITCLEGPMIARTRFQFISSPPKDYGGIYKSDFTGKEMDIEFGKKASFAMSTNDEYSIDGGFVYSEDCTIPANSPSIIVPIFEPDFIITSKPLGPSFFAKWLILLLISISITSSCLEIFNWKKTKS